jgi:sodium/proline symporter
MNHYGALAGIIVGGITVVIWKQLGGGLFDLYELVPGFLAAAAAVVVTSLLTPPPSPASQKTFDEVQQLLYNQSKITQQANAS